MKNILILNSHLPIHVTLKEKTTSYFKKEKKKTDFLRVTAGILIASSNLFYHLFGTAGTLRPNFTNYFKYHRTPDTKQRLRLSICPRSFLSSGGLWLIWCWWWSWLGKGHHLILIYVSILVHTNPRKEFNIY